MNSLALFYFIVQHFLQARVHNVIVLNCWDGNSRLQFLRIANDHLLMTQFVNMDKKFEFPGEHFSGPVTALGVILDLKCNRSQIVVKNVSFKIKDFSCLFHVMCENVKNVAVIYELLKSSDLHLFIAKYNWLLLDDARNYFQFLKQFSNVDMSIDAQITYASIDSNSEASILISNTSLTLYDVYNNGKHIGGKLNVTADRRLTCNEAACETEYLSELRLRTKYAHRCNLSDITFRVSTVVTTKPNNLPPEVLLEFLRSIDNPHVDTIARYSFKLIAVLQDVMGYNVKYIFRSAWSVSEDDGGSIGDLRHDSAEVSSSPFIITFDRLRWITPLQQIGDFRSIFLFRTPRNEGLYGGVFLSPFSSTVWLVFGVVIVLFAVLLWIVFAVEVRAIRFMKFIPSLLSTFLISFGMACVQGSVLIPRTTGGRITFFSLSLVTFIMYNYYTSLVVSSLVGSPIKSNIKTISQLADSSLDIGLEPVPYTASFIYYPKSWEVQKLIDKKLKERLPMNSSLWLPAEEGLSRVKRGGFAYHTEASSSYRLIEKTYEQQEMCDLNELQMRSETTLHALMNKNSTYKEVVRISLQRMLERGVVSRHRRFWMKTKLHCFTNNILINVGLEYTGPLFALLGSIYIFVLIVLLFEIAYHRFATKRKNRF